MLPARHSGAYPVDRGRGVAREPQHQQGKGDVVLQGHLHPGGAGGRSAGRPHRRAALLLAGLLIQAGGLGWLAVISSPAPAYSELVIPLIVAGVGVSMAIPAGQSSAMGALGVTELGRAAGANSTMRELGGVFGIAVVVAVFAAAGSYASPAEFGRGFAAAVGLAAGLSLAGAITAAALPGRARLDARLGLAARAELE